MKSIPEEVKLAIVIPCYNEEEVLSTTTEELSKMLEDLIEKEIISRYSFILYVNDGSKDKTWTLIQQYHKTNHYICGINLAGNVGHQNALVAGLTIAKEYADVIITVDADLQDDIHVVEEMITKYNEGFDIVYGVRKSRATDSWFKRTTALGFYSLMKYMGVKSVYNHADYRLMSNRAVEHLLLYKERNLFLRGIVPLIGYQSACVYYNRAERFAGESKYPLKKMINFALDGITSFSITPVHMIFYLGCVFLAVSLAISVWVLYAYLTEKVIPGWSSLMLSLWFCSGCVLTGLGIVGEYIGKIYIETKNRPRFNIEQILFHETAKKSNDF